MTDRKHLTHKPGHKLIFRPYFIHAVTGRKIYPKTRRIFPIWVKTEGTQLDLENLN